MGDDPPAKPTPEWRACTKRPVAIEFRDAVPGEVITTIEGVRITMTADHLVMRGTRGELYPITKAIFHETYDVGDYLCHHANPNMDEDPCLLGITRPCNRCGRYVIASCRRAGNCPLRPGSRCKGTRCGSYQRRD